MLLCVPYFGGYAALRAPYFEAFSRSTLSQFRRFAEILSSKSPEPLFALNKTIRRRANTRLTFAQQTTTTLEHDPFFYSGACTSATPARPRVLYISFLSLCHACVCSPLGAHSVSRFVRLRGRRRELNPIVVDRSVVRGISRSGEASLYVMHNRGTIDSRENCRKMIA